MDSAGRSRPPRNRAAGQRRAPLLSPHQQAATPLRPAPSAGPDRAPRTQLRRKTQPAAQTKPGRETAPSAPLARWQAPPAHSLFPSGIEVQLRSGPISFPLVTPSPWLIRPAQPSTARPRQGDRGRGGSAPSGAVMAMAAGPTSARAPNPISFLRRNSGWKRQLPEDGEGGAGRHDAQRHTHASRHRSVARSVCRSLGHSPSPPRNQQGFQNGGFLNSEKEAGRRRPISAHSPAGAGRGRVRAQERLLLGVWMWAKCSRPLRWRQAASGGGR